MKKIWAILDLGTNTFHLLIVSILSDYTFHVLYKAEEFVKLGENGLNTIGEKPFQRAVQQIRKYKQVVDQYHPERIIAFGTAAIRNASNGDELIKEIQEVCPMEVRKISGDEEAELIYHGVREAINLGNEVSLIIDIGGGSTEFIFADQEKIFWKESYPVGASVLKQQFHHHEPISPIEVTALENFLEIQLEPVFFQAKNYLCKNLVGASGSFDSFAMMISENFLNKPFDQTTPFFKIDPVHFNLLYEDLIGRNLSERLETRGLVSFRAEMIVVAIILAEFVIDKLHIQSITQSAYALKEGALWKMMRNEKV